ncbi:unnamed protein product [Brachionus calyciflorus]|uniref:Ninjurin-2 n=1 Tax=Brachionus calyciflorus TaxID=104777 RepID=A0A813MK81_9BILA|nr:unnamed protein product [Brachionus calyciflorus]
MSKDTNIQNTNTVTARCDFCKHLTVKSDNPKVSANVDLELGPVKKIENYVLKNVLKTPEALLPQDRKKPATGTVDPNVYTIKKSLATILCLIIIIMSNSIQIKYVLKHGKALFNQFYSIQITLGTASILLSTLIGFLLLYSAKLNFNDVYKHRKSEFLNNLSMILLFILCIVNIFITAMN